MLQKMPTQFGEGRIKYVYFLYSFYKIQIFQKVY